MFEYMLMHYQRGENGGKRWELITFSHSDVFR